MRTKLTLRPARPGEEAAQRDLWYAAFGDSDAYLDLFYQNLYTPDRVVGLYADGELRSMCALLPVTYRAPHAPPRGAAYLYALATHPAARGRGYARRLLQWVDESLARQGFDAVCTVPAEASLHRFFEACGYQPGFSLDLLRGEIAALPPPDVGDAAAEISAQTYEKRRSERLSDTPHIAYDVNFLTHQAAVCRLAGGGLFALTVGGAPGLAVVERHGTCLVCKELLVPQGLEHRAAATLAARLPAETYELRRPPQSESAHPFGRAKSLQGGKSPTGYLALALD